MADGHLFNNISLGGRGGTKQGQMRVHSGGVLWKKLGGGKAVEVDKSNIAGLFWMKVQRSNQLGVRSKEGLYYKFIGFRDQDNFKHIYIWNGLQCHHFKQKIGLELSGEDDTEHRPDRTQMSSHSPGSVLAPMSGLVVKVLGKNGEKVEAGQPVVVMEAMKMEHVVKSPSNGFIHGLQVVPGQQVSDGSVLFIVKEE